MAKTARPVLIQDDHEFLRAYFSIPEHYEPKHTIAEIRRWEGIKEVLVVLEKQFTCPS